MFSYLKSVSVDVLTAGFLESIFFHYFFYSMDLSRFPVFSCERVKELIISSHNLYIFLRNPDTTEGFCSSYKRSSLRGGGVNARDVFFKRSVLSKAFVY